MPRYIGVIVYEIFADGCLSGVGSDTYPETKNKIFNEIARKKEGQNVNEIVGTYTYVFASFNDSAVECILEIQKEKENVGRYAFNWYQEGKNTYKGFGWLTKPNQFLVYYEYLEI